ncbi:MAG: hypothetical protein HZB26_01530 [Candidatus Hydrogenedentes bacterium]|nr:hypothetical protein [Candidatus Hydrogenedentota bacterium]
MIGRSCLSIVTSCLIAAPSMAAVEVREGDAFARADAENQTWTIGAKAAQMTFASKDGQFRLVSFQNTLTAPAREYASSSAPFGVEPLSVGAFALEKVWSKPMGAGTTIDPAADKLRLNVKTGDLIGFGVATYSDEAGATVNWTTTLDYGDGVRFSSSEDTELNQGPVWQYYTRAPGTGCMDLLGEVIQPPTPGQPKFRVPSGYRAPAECSSLGATKFYVANAYEMVRVWKAPKDGVVTIHGAAQHAGGSAVHLNAYRIAARASKPIAAPDGRDRWVVESGTVQQVAVGGRPAVQLNLVLNRDGLRALLHVQAYPGTSILRQWVEFENTTNAAVTLASPTPLSIGLRRDDPTPLTNYWMCGGTSRPNQGQLESAEAGATYHHALLGDRTDNYVPWMALTRQKSGEPGDGLFVALDDLGTWTLGVDYATGQGALTASFPALTDYSLAAGERLRLPLVTLGVFDGDLDDMGRRVYDWQYEYLWDYTNSDYFARTKWTTSWFFCSRNLQEQFAARLAGLDMDADLLRTMGMEMLWDDAGWSKYPGWPIEDSYAVVFSPTYEGPDFAETLRYLGKMNMNWLLWMAGRPTAGLLDTKVGSWGNFQWRTDGFGRFGLKSEFAIRAQIEHFLQANPRCSFHTCCGGSRYAHQFEIQRYADVNYLSDMGRGDQTNHYLSYLELPDKWLDLMDALIQPGAKYNPATGPGQLSMAPGWYMQASGPEQEQLRRLMEVYRYLRREGVAGRWSHMTHPEIKGDKDFYYDQRINYDGAKACIILKHPAKGEVTIYPKGLLAEHNYKIGFEVAKDRATRTGADLMANGIVLKDTAPGELIYLGLPDMPGAGRDTVAPNAPGRALTQRETNIGHSGVGVYWSPTSDTRWISYYEVRRNEKIVGKASVGAYFFDHSPGWDAKSAYAVRAVNGDGVTSAWTPAKPLANGPDVYAALGGHFSEAGRDGWSAETSTDSRAVVGMTWVVPAKSPAGDTGGTPNQPGGVEGYWEGPGQARVGRGWQQASPEAACVRTWTAPKSGTVTVVGRAMKECYRQAMGAPLRVRILHADKQVWPEQGWAEVPINNLQGVMHDFSLKVAAGDTLRFVLDRGVSPDTDIIAWMPRIVYAHPDPKSKGTCIRIVCGANKPYTDHTGNVWSKDAYFTGGNAASTTAAISNTLPTTDDVALYQQGRTGRDFTYTIPVKPGLYTARLKFAETTYAWSFERPFNLTINGRRVLDNFDICQAAHGPNRAYERVFHNLVPDEKGKLVFRFTGGFEPMQKTDEAIVQAIEILPETRPVIRIDAGAERDFIDWNGFIWTADAHFDGGTIVRSEAPVLQASPTLYDQALYQTARSGRTFSYTVPVPPGVYVVHLKFAELWLKAPGQRPMTIEVNGRTVRDHWDPAEATGHPGMAADIRVEDVTPDKNNTITIRVTATGTNDAILQGIEIE